MTFLEAAEQSWRIPGCPSSLFRGTGALPHPLWWSALRTLATGTITLGDRVGLIVAFSMSLCGAHSRNGLGGLLFCTRSGNAVLLYHPNILGILKARSLLLPHILALHGPHHCQPTNAWLRVGAMFWHWLTEYNIEPYVGLPLLWVLAQFTPSLLDGIMIICLLLVFYALALWDRWITLKLYERQRLQGELCLETIRAINWLRGFILGHRLHVNYGTIESGISITRTPSPKLDKQCSSNATTIPTSNGKDLLFVWRKSSTLSSRLSGASKTGRSAVCWPRAYCHKGLNAWPSMIQSSSSI